MILKYTDSEVNKYHPICERALNEALKLLKIDKSYKVEHHEKIKSLEMDFVIKNKKTGNYICIIEVKRTPSDVNSMRYQKQVHSYAQEASSRLEKPYYVLTNLEYSYLFRYDSSREKVAQQILSPGLIKVGKFDEYSGDEFRKIIKEHFRDLLLNILEKHNEYFISYNEFENYLLSIKGNSKEWKNSLSVLLYEYIRGVFKGINRKPTLKNSVRFKKNLKDLCSEGSKINFEAIFSLKNEDTLIYPDIDNKLLNEIYKLGEQNLNGDSVADIIHHVACEGQESEGKVSTDIELSRALSYLIKNNLDGKEIKNKICDPAAGSGALISSTIEAFNLNPSQILANDIDDFLIGLISLRLGLKFPEKINNKFSPIINDKDITNLNKSYFDNVEVIVLNPPYLSGVKGSGRKLKFNKKIKEITGKKSKVNKGQIGLEAVFLELVDVMTNNETIIGCIFPQQYLNSRSNEFQIFREYLINDFGLETMFTYPSDGLFEDVKKDTCIFIGKKNSTKKHVDIISSYEKLSHISLEELSLIRFNELSNFDEFNDLFFGVEGMKVSKNKLLEDSKNGWNFVSSELLEAIKFTNDSCFKNLELIKNLDSKLFRGGAANKGVSDLIFLKDNDNFDKNIINKLDQKFLALEKAKDIQNICIKETPKTFFKIDEIKSKVLLDNILNSYIKNSTNKLTVKKQFKKIKTKYEILKILEKEINYIVNKYSVLIPRALRTFGRVFYSKKDIAVSTNFFVLRFDTEKEAKIISSWMSTIIFQLFSELAAKDQEGMRKLEKVQIEELPIPNLAIIDNLKYIELEKIIKNIKFLELNNPKIREIDKFWGEIIFGKDYKIKVDEARKLLKFLATRRNPPKIKKNV